jgi:hypothetical protein
MENKGVISSIRILREACFALLHFTFFHYHLLHLHLSVRLTHLSQHRDRCVMGHLWAKYARGIPPGIPGAMVRFMWWQRFFQTPASIPTPASIQTPGHHIHLHIFPISLTYIASSSSQYPVQSSEE